MKYVTAANLNTHTHTHVEFDQNPNDIQGPQVEQQKLNLRDGIGDKGWGGGDVSLKHDKSIHSLPPRS